MRTGTRSWTAAALLAALALLPACRGKDAAPAAGRGGTLVVALGAEPDSLNVYLARVAESALVANRFLPRLARELTPDPERPDGLAPELAEGWSLEDGGRTLTFRLRDGRRWSDGEPVTCEDVAFTYRAQVAPELGWRAASIKRHITAVECPEPARAVFRFDRGYPGQVVDANDLHLLPRSLAALPFDEWRNVDWATRLAAAGPFRLGKVTPGQEIVLERNAGWGGGADLPRLERIVLRVVPDPAARVTGLLSGEFHLVETILPDDAARIGSAGGVRVVRRPDWAYTYLGWNTVDPEAYRAYRARREKECAGAGDCPDDAAAVARLALDRPHPLFGDARVRRAMTLALDRPALIDALLRGEGEVPASPILPPSPAHDPALAAAGPDLGAAKALLREAGFADADADGTLERAGRPFRFTLLVQAGKADRRGAAVLVQQQLARAGVAVDIQPVENSVFYPSLSGHQMDAWIGSWRTSPRVDMTEMLHASACSQQGNNFGCWSHPEADHLASEARDVLDDARRNAMWQRWEALFRDEQPYTILYRPTLLTGVSARVRGADALLPNDVLNGVEEWWLADEPGR
ncbi:MAG: hypothetical protein KBD01_15955 [Acidobacteria bacterium]|nr:hypothetical protein [Acidobacteriota bacterium]